MRKVLDASLIFFEENTHGVILNRFSKDIMTLDNCLFIFIEMVDYINKVLMALIVVVIMSPWIIIILLGSIVYLIKLRRTTLISLRDPNRLKFSLMSPVNSIIQDAVNGLPTLRCLK